MPLFAFQDFPAADAEFPPWILVIAIVTIGLLFAGFALWLIVKQAAKSREMSHLERMKVIESGQPIGPSEAEKCQAKYLHNVFWICFWVGAGVPIAATSAVTSVMIQTKLQDFFILRAIWICVAVISTASVICATALMVASGHWATKGQKKSSGNGSAV